MVPLGRASGDRADGRQDHTRNAGRSWNRAGIEMMSIWYNPGPGKQIIKRGVDFLYFQSGSQGYASVVKGPKDQVGSFTLVGDR